MDASWEHYLNSIRKFREEAGESAREIEEFLSTLTEIREHLSAIEDLMTNKPEQRCQEIATVRAACEMVLSSDYMGMTNSAIGVSMVCSKIEEVDPKIPAEMQPKVKEIKGYYEKIKEQCNEIDELTKDLKQKFKEARKKEYKISPTEKTDFDLIVLDLEEGIKICSQYLSQADKVLKMLETDITSYLVKNGVLALVGGSLVYVGASEVVGTVALLAKGAKAIGKASGLVGVSLALYKIYSFYVLLVGAAVLYQVGKRLFRWFAKINYNLKLWFAESPIYASFQLFWIIRNYTDLTNKSQRHTFRGRSSTRVNFRKQAPTS